VPELPAQDQLLAPIRMTAHLYYASRRPDLDPSLILDALQGRVYRNDRAVREMHLYHHLDRENPRAEILLEEMTDDE
jgi:Holliday junction resolvase RusA-like endonuclease